MKKKLLVVLGLLAICKLGYSQAIVYTYDAAGNRIKRATSKTVTRSIPDDYAEDSEEGIAGKNLNVTERDGKITILIKELDPDNPYEISLYSSNGIMYLSKTIDTNSTAVSLLDYPIGTYILNIKYKEETTTYKFAKK